VDDYNVDDYNDNNQLNNHLKLLREEIRLLADNTYENERLLYGFAYSTIIFISIFGNFLVCKICLQKLTKTNMLIISMAISDLMMTIFNIPFNFYRLFNYSWPFGYWICFLINFIQHLTVYNSTYTMTIIALQRYRSVNHFQITSSSSSSNQFIQQQQQQQQPRQQQQKRNNSNNEIKIYHHIY
ncbi:G-protein coupled receptor 83-like, partial [Dermatophagoides pteronyssinus]|uniref:G-protein coupled receptor 83-like n=1 Tax=Dermatophagoides pteronyssinus TaxID=6956 RepID=UPI003F669DF3